MRLPVSAHLDDPNGGEEYANKTRREEKTAPNLLRFLHLQIPDEFNGQEHDFKTCQH